MSKASPKNAVGRKKSSGPVLQRRMTRRMDSEKLGDKDKNKDKDKDKDKLDDPLKALMAAAIKKNEETRKETAEVAKKKRKTYIGQKAIRVIKKPQTSMMAVAMRQFFIKSLKKFLATGQMKSKYFYKFEILDVISPKCYVIQPKSRSVQSQSQSHQKFIFKQLNSESINNFCGNSNPTAAQVNSIIDPWINLVPKTPYIVTAYEVFRDYYLFMQMTEYADGFDNVYSRLRKAKFGLLQESIPRQLIRMVYLFVIQISHAFSYAHTCNLTHGKFDLTQVLLDSSMTEFKVTNFRPWLALGMKYELTQDCESHDFRNLADDQKYRIAKSRDLFAFGEAIYDLMLNKSDKGEKIQQKVVFRGGLGDPSKMKSTGDNSEMTSASQKKLNNADTVVLGQKDPEIMPIMETIPLAWVQITEGATIIDILHHCMLVDTKRDTVKLFNHINRQATEVYQKYFDSSFKPLPLASTISEEFMVYFRVAGLNNRAVMTQFKLMSHQLGKEISELDNQVILDYQEKLFLHCVQKDPLCEEANINLVLLLWKRGKLFDEQVCDEIFSRIEDRNTAQLLILAFRKANRYPVDQNFEQNVMKQEPSDNLASQVSKQLKNIHASQSQSQNGLFGSSGTVGLASSSDQKAQPQQITSMLTHITSTIPGAAQLQQANEDSGNPKEQLPQIDVKRIVFSKNEKFMVLITKTQVVVLKINPGKYDCIGQFDLPKTVDYKNCDQDTLRDTLEKTSTKITRIDLLQAATLNQGTLDSIGAGQTQSPGSPTHPVNNIPLDTVHGVAQQNGNLNSQNASGMEDSQKMRSSSIDGISSQTSVFGEEASTDNDVAQQRRRRTAQKQAGDEKETEEQVERRRQQRERECIGGGFMNTEWIAAIDNTGETLCLHTNESVQLIEKQSFDEDSNFSRYNSQNDLKANGQDADDQNSRRDKRARDRQEMQLVSEIHVYSGFKFMQHTKIQIGHLCPDEVLDLEMDKMHQGGIPPSTDSFAMPYSEETLKQYEKAEAERFAARKALVTQNEQNTILYKDGQANFKQVIADSPRFASGSNSPQKQSSIVVNNVETSPIRTVVTHPNMRAISFQSTEELSIGKNSVSGEELTMIKEHATANDSSLEDINGMQIGSVMLTDAARPASSGSLIRIPSFGRVAAAKFGLKKYINVKCKNMKSYDLAFAVDRMQLAENFPMVVLQGEPMKLPGGANIPTSLFRDPCHKNQTQSEADAKQSANGQSEEQQIGSYKLLHYEHMREWIQQQELKGNIIKFSLLDSKYCIGFQRSTYRGMKPHFFVYEILKRKVVRRFMPMLDSFKQEWDLTDANNFRGAGTNQFQYAAKQGSLLNPADSDLDGTSNDENAAEEYVEDVSVFEVSPQGNFLVALVSNEFITLKMLPRSSTAAFRKLLTPSFMIQEHIAMSFEQDYLNYSITESQDSTSKQLKYEKDVDQNLFVVTVGNKENTSQSSDQNQKTLAEQLISAFSCFEDFVGSTFHKHQRLYRYYHMLTVAFSDTNALIYPPTSNQAIKPTLATQQSIDSDLAAAVCEENVQILPKTLRKVLTAIKEYNFSFSVLTPQTHMLSGNIVANNLFSKKTGVISLKKLCVFDQILFDTPEDQIKQIIFSSFPRNWQVAVFFRRKLQVYDQITGQQIFELVCPSARKISFIDSENLLVVLEGQSQVYICAVNSQRQAFLNREMQVRRGEQPLVQEYEENQKYSQYTIGISVQRQDNQKHGKYSDQEETSEHEEENIGIKLIVFDEVIKQMVTSRNVSPFGYLALIGETKLSIYLTYAEEDSCTYDHIWTINFWDLRKLKIGKRIELIDFSPNCEEFIAYSNTGDFSLWSIKKIKFIKRLKTLNSSKQTPITHMRSLKNNLQCVAFSQPNNILVILDIGSSTINAAGETVQGNTKVRQIRPEAEGFGKLLTFQVDHSEQFLICTFNNDKVGIYSTVTGSLCLQSDQPGMLCSGSYIDETGCFISMLDETKTKANIYVIEWQYQVEPPPARRRMSTIESLDAPSEKGAQDIKGDSKKERIAERIAQQIKNGEDGADIAQMRLGSKKSSMTQKERRRLVIEADKKKAAEEKKAAAEQNKNGTSKVCAIF